MLLLRDTIDTDLPVFFENQRDVEANEMADFPARERDVFMTHWREKVLGNSSVRKKTVISDGNVAGNVVSWEQEGKRFVGYWLGKNYWGKGIATWALSEFLVQEAKRPLYAHVAEHNFGSIRVLEKCGFRRTGSDENGLFWLEG
jgi:RimJ/RimL family protein N-acetyltransferase